MSKQTKEEECMPTSEEEFQADLDAQDMRYLQYCREQEEMYNDPVKKKYTQLNLDFTIRPEDLDNRPQHVINEERGDEIRQLRREQAQMEMFDDPVMNWSGLR